MQVIDPRTPTIWADYKAKDGRSAAALRKQFQIQFRPHDSSEANVCYPPPIFDKDLMDAASAIAVELHRLIVSIPKRIFDNDYRKMLELQGLRGVRLEQILAVCNTRTVALAAGFCRPDMLISKSGIHAVEMNFSPAIGGLALCEAYIRSFNEFGYADELRRAGVSTSIVPTMEIWNKALASLNQTNCDTAGKIHIFIGLLDQNELATPSDSLLEFSCTVRGLGYSVTIGLLQELRIGDDMVTYSGDRVDIVYSMCAYSEIFWTGICPDQLLQLVLADNAGIVTFIGPVAPILLDNKANLAILTDPEYSAFFNTAELEFIAKCVPRTRLLSEQTYSMAAYRREDLILKPTTDFAGNMVIVGESIEHEEWLKALDLAIAADDICYVIQERVRDLFKWNGGLDDTTPDDSYTILLGPFVLGGIYAGACVRQTRSKLRTPIVSAARNAAPAAALSGC